MKVKDQVLKQLEDNKGTYFSGSELAAALGVSEMPYGRQLSP